MVSWEWAVERLEAARNYWLATTKADGSPHAMPVWGLWLDGVVLFSTSPDSIKARNFGRDPRAVMHVADGEDIVILEGEVADGALDDDTADLCTPRSTTTGPSHRAPPAKGGTAFACVGHSPGARISRVRNASR